jgi:hypothetical protein
MRCKSSAEFVCDTLGEDVTSAIVQSPHLRVSVAHGNDMTQARSMQTDKVCL